MLIVTKRNRYESLLEESLIEEWLELNKELQFQGVLVRGICLHC